MSLGKKEIDAIERRADNARLTMRELCELAGILQPTWSRAKSKGRVSVSTIRRLEEQLAKVEGRPDGK